MQKQYCEHRKWLLSCLAVLSFVTFGLLSSIAVFSCVMSLSGQVARPSPQPPVLGAGPPLGTGTLLLLLTLLSAVLSLLLPDPVHTVVF